MIRNKKVENELAKQLLKDEITWDGYLKRFEGNTPIEIWKTYNYKMNMCPIIVESDIDFGTEGISSRFNRKVGRKFGTDHKIVLGFEHKMSASKIQSMGCIDVAASGVRYALREDYIDIMFKTCPDDFEALPVTIISLSDKAEYEIKNYYIINILKYIDAIDREKSGVFRNEYGSLRTPYSQKPIYYKEDPWCDGAISYTKIYAEKYNKDSYEYFKLDKPCKVAVDMISAAVIWHPELAGKFPHNIYNWFITGPEQGRI